MRILTITPITLKYHLLNASMKVWGDNPAGWRMRNVIFGSLSVAVLFLIGIELFSSVRVAGLAAAFLAFDPLHLSCPIDL